MRFDLNVEGHDNNTLVDNANRNLVSKLKVKFGCKTLQDTERYDLLNTCENIN